MPLRVTLTETIEDELRRVRSCEPAMPRELYLHPSDYGEVLRSSGEWGASRFEFREEYSVRPLQGLATPRDLAARVENITTFLGVVLRSNRLVPPGFMIALYADRHPAVEVYRFDKALPLPGVPSCPRVPAVPHRSLWDRLRAGER